MNVPSWLKASLITSAQTAGGLILLAVIDLLLDVQDWVSDPTNRVDFSSAGKLILGAIIAALTGVIAAVHRKINPPEVTYNTPEG